MADYLLFSLNRLEKYRYRQISCLYNITWPVLTGHFYNFIPLFAQSTDCNIVYCSNIESIELLKSDLNVAECNLES